MSEKDRTSSTPGRKPGTLNSVPTPYDQLPPIDTLNPDNLKDLDKYKLQAYLKNHNIVPAPTKPEMKKQMRTLIHSLTNKGVEQPIIGGVGGVGVGVGGVGGVGGLGQHNIMHPHQPIAHGTPIGFQSQPVHQFPGATTVQQQIQQQLFAQQQAHSQAQLQQQIYAQQQAQAQFQAQLLLQQQLIQQQQQQQALAEIQRQREFEIQLQRQQQQQQAALEQQQKQQLLLQQQQLAAQQAAQQAAEKEQKERLEREKQSSQTPKSKKLKTDSGRTSPPPSPRTTRSGSISSASGVKEVEQIGEQCIECRAKKANKECNNKRCRGCCIKLMLDKKSEICYLHLRDEARRPRIKDAAQTEVIAELIAQAQKEAAANGTTLSGSRENSQSNTPATSTPTLSSKAATPMLDSPNLLLDDDSTKDKDKDSKIIIDTGKPQPTQQMQQSLQQPQSSQPPQQGKNDSFGRKIQSYYNNYYIGVQAQVAACSNPKRLTPAKDDRYSFFSCYHCDKVISVNGFNLWKHIQTEHKEDFFKFVKECMKTDTRNLFNNSSNLYNNTKQKTTERFNLTIKWLEELFSPLPPPEITDKEFFKTRMEMLVDFGTKLDQLIDSFDKRIDPKTSKFSILETFLKDSETFHKYYDGLSTITNNDELESLISQYENEKDVHFEQRPLLITPYHPSSTSSTGKRKAAFEIIESDPNFTGYHSF